MTKVSLKLKGDLIIAYGSENVTLNKGAQHMILTKDELIYIAQSALKNTSFEIICTEK